MPGLCMYSRLLHGCSVVLLETHVSFTICRSTFFFCLVFKLTTEDRQEKKHQTNSVYSFYPLIERKPVVMPRSSHYDTTQIQTEQTLGLF